MEKIGNIERRKIFYVSVREDENWWKSLPKKDWVAFTMANEEDIEIVPPAVKRCIDNNVSYTCSAGELASLTDDFFDEEYLFRNNWFVDKEVGDDVLMTSFHKNFDEGFWFAACVANDDLYEIDKVVCLDFTKRRVKKHLKDLILKINFSWLPSDEEIKEPNYDRK